MENSEIYIKIWKNYMKYSENNFPRVVWIFIGVLHHFDGVFYYFKRMRSA